jgi:hypothetical protein
MNIPPMTGAIAMMSNIKAIRRLHLSRLLCCLLSKTPPPKENECLSQE